MRTSITEKEMMDLQTKCGSRVIFDGKSCIKNITDKSMYDNCIMYSKNRNQHIKNSVKWTPMNDEWRERCRKNMFWYQETLEEMKRMYPEMDDRLYTLRAKLLDFAGDAVCILGYESDLSELLTHGQFWVGNNVKMMRGQSRQCHSNSAKIWLDNQEDMHICTGYALSDDGMWRQHSWGVWNKKRSNQIIETTEPRILYYGFAMPPDMCEQFADYNYCC